jgi:hypothetical protein
MRFEAHSLTATRFVSHETLGNETQTGLWRVYEPQTAGVALAGGPAASKSMVTPHE